MEEKLEYCRIQQENLDHELDNLNQEIEVQSQIKIELKEKKLEIMKENEELSNQTNNANKAKNNEQMEEFLLEEKMKKLINIFMHGKSFNIVENSLDDFKKMKKRYDRPMFGKKEILGVIETIQIKFDPLDVSDCTPITIRITSDYYTVVDLLEEVCIYHNLNFKIFDLFDEFDNKIPLTLSLKNFLDNKPDGIINRFVQLRKDSKLAEHYKEEIQINFNKAGTSKSDKSMKLLPIDLINAEENIINRYFTVIVYFFFLACVFTKYLVRFGVQENYIIDSAIGDQMFQRVYISNNVNGLENNFQNIINTSNIYEWLYNIYLKIFTYREGRNE